MMTHLSTTSSLPFTYSVAGSEGQGNTSGLPNDGITTSPNLVIDYLIFTTFLVVCAFGMVGNGTVLWYLCFIIKKNPITTYVLNLAAADFAVIISLIVFCTTYSNVKNKVSELLLVCFFFTYSCSQYLLTAISIERCLSVISPIWYRCHRPKYLSTVICALLWVLSCLPFGLLLSFINDAFTQSIFFINVILCTPLVLTSTVVLFIRVYCSLHRQQHGRFYTVLFIALLIFLFFGTPLSIVLLYISFENTDIVYTMIPVMGACINSSVNPLIYFLIGKKKMHRSRASFKLVFQRVFSDNVDCREGVQPI